MRILLVLLLALALAGCLGDDAPAEGSEPVVAARAEDAGALAGDTPRGATEPYRALASDATTGGEATEVVAHPLKLATNPAKEPITLEFDGVFNATDCMGIGLNLGPVSMRGNHHRDLREHFSPGDVFEYDLRLTYEARSGSPVEIHMIYGIGNKIVGHNEPVGDKTGTIDQNFTGQSYRVTSDDMAWVAVNCWYGRSDQPTAYHLTVKLRFAEAAIPAESPILVPVPEGATRLLVQGVAVDPARGVNSHYRLFGPDDTLVCECVLGSTDEASFVDLPGPGDYVLLVDHTSNGFVSVALDAPPVRDLNALESEFVLHKIYTSPAETNVDKTFDLPLAKVPLLMHAFTTTEGASTGVGQGKSLVVEVTNERGVPLRIGWGGFLTHRANVGPINTNQWWGMGLDPAEWSYAADHHAYAVGDHQVHFQAESFRGDLYVVTREYIR